MIGGEPRVIVFTSGGTEGINLAIRGALAMRPGRRHFVTTAVEDSAGLRVAEQLQREGHAVDYIGVDRDGRVDQAEWAAKVTDRTALVSVMHANNETGVILDVPRLAAIASDRGVPVHVDAVQSIGKTPVDVSDWPVQLVSLSAHKFHGPKGVGALYVRRRTRLATMILGGNQEHRLRGGTENVPGIVGMALAATAVTEDAGVSIERVREMRDALESGILSSVSFAHVNGAGAERIANTTNVSFEGLEAEAILILLSEAGIYASAGSACSSGSLETSHVLKAMGLGERLTHGAVRFSLSKFNTPDEMHYVVEALPDILSRLTSLAR